ncbi:MAG: glycoside hydrolase family 88 protein [Bacillota bacterium]|nr:glycoside hydrolase family 88 protein [Bacillota bacterium]
MIAKIFIGSILCLIALVMVIDFIPLFKDWINRIKIGRYLDVEEWSQSIVKTGVEWLKKTPLIKVTDNTRLIMVDMLRGNYKSNAIQSWQEAALILGLSEYMKIHTSKQIRNQIVNYIEYQFDYSGQWITKPKNVDAALLSYAIMKSDCVDIQKYKRAFDFTWDLIKEHIGEDGCVAYRNGMKSYRYVDTIGFICPFLIAYGLRFNKKECIELAIKQIKQFEQSGMHEIEQMWVPYHAYKIENHIPLGLYGWGRGLAWFSIGVMDSWKELPPHHKYKKTLEESVKKLAKSILIFQQDNGNWNWTIGRDECRPDSSTTAVLGWFMVNASTIKDISKECEACSEKALNYLMTVTRRDGAVDFSQGDTKDIGVYSMTFSILPFTQGFSIRAISSYKNQGLVKNNVKKSS